MSQSPAPFDLPAVGLGAVAMRGVRRHRVRTAITIVAVMLGVTLMTASLITVVNLQSTLEQAARRLTGQADLFVRVFGETAFEADEIAAIARLPGVTGVAPQSEQRVFYRTPTGHGFLRLLGVVPESERSIQDVRVVAGRYLTSSVERTVVVPSDWAASQGLAVGDVIELMGREGLTQFRIVGLLDLPGPLLLGSEPLAYIALGAAEQLFVGAGRPGQLALRLEPDSPPAEVIGRLTGVLRHDFVPVTAAEILGGATTTVQALRDALVFSGAITLFVGAFLINNTLTMAAREQRREFGLLRTAGALPRQVMRLVIQQGVVIGLTGSIAGVALGYALAWLLSRWFTGGQSGSLLSPGIVGAMLLAGAAGLGTAVVASLYPARAAAKLRPIEALRLADSSVAQSSPSFESLTGAGIATLLCATLLALSTGDGWSPYLRALAALGLLIGLSALMPLWIGPLSRAFGALLSPWLGISARLAGVNLTRSRARTRATVSAVLVSVALTLALVLIGDDAKAGGQEWAGALFPGNYLVVSPVVQPDDLATHLGGGRSITSFSRIRRFETVWRRQPISALAIEWPEGRLVTAPLSQGNPVSAAEALRTGSGILIARPLAESLNLRVGDILPLETAAGPVALPIAGVLQHPLPSPDNLGPVVVGWPALERSFGLTGFQWLVVDVAPEGESSLARRAEELGLELVPTRSVREAVGERLDQTLVLFGALVGSCLLVAGLGIANTLLMNVSERTHEIAVLRAAGMTRRQVVVMTVLEAIFMAVCGGVVGVLAGSFLALMTTSARPIDDIAPRLVLSATFPAGLVALAVSLSAIAALYPAWRAASVAVAEATKRE